MRRGGLGWSVIQRARAYQARVRILLQLPQRGIKAEDAGCLVCKLRRTQLGQR